MHIRKWTVVAVAGAALSLAGVVGVGPVWAGAAPSNNTLIHGSGAMSPPAASIVPGTYTFFVNGANVGAISLASGNTFTAAIDSDSGTWVQAGKTAALTFTGGSDAAGGCVFAGKVNKTGTGNQARPSRAIGSAQALGRTGPSTSRRVSRPRRRCTAISSPARTVSTVPPDRWFSAPTRGRWTAPTRAPSPSRRATPTPAHERQRLGCLGPRGESRRPDDHRRPRRGRRMPVRRQGQQSRNGHRNHQRPGNWVCPGFATSGTFVTS